MSFFFTLTICLITYLPGKNQYPSIWQDLSSSPIDSSNFLILTSLLLLFAVGGGLYITRYLLAAFPSDEMLECDRTTLTISKVPWLDMRNSRWVSQSYPLAQVVKMRFATIVPARGGSIKGIRFSAGGRDRKVLLGIEAPEAAQILKALAALGADVVDDSELAKKVEETLGGRY